MVALGALAIACGGSDGNSDVVCTDAFDVDLLVVQQGETAQLSFDFAKCNAGLSSAGTFVEVDEAPTGLSVIIESLLIESLKVGQLDARKGIATIMVQPTFDVAQYVVQLQAREFDSENYEAGTRSVVARVVVEVTGEDCWNGVDDDDDNEIDCEDPDNCAPRPACMGIEECGNFRDDDGDGDIDCADMDCSGLSQCYVGECTGDAPVSSISQRGNVGDSCRTDNDCHSARCCNDDTECGERPCQCRRGDSF
jgi:hypothetical protein